MESTLINEGLTLMLYGMGTVFVFLTILVFATQAMSALANRFSTAEEQPKKTNTPLPSMNPSTSEAPSPTLVAAIEKAIAAHRAKNRS